MILINPKYKTPPYAMETGLSHSFHCYSGIRLEKALQDKRKYH